MDHSSALPGPSERPESDVVIFDGQCRFCTKQIRRFERCDRGRRLSYLSLHDSEVNRRYPNLTHQQLMDEMYVMDAKGGQHAGAAAFRYLTRKLPWLWPAAPLMHVPFSLPLWRWAYRQVSKRRYRLAQDDGCDSGACEVHLR